MCIGLRGNAIATLVIRSSPGAPSAQAATSGKKTSCGALEGEQAVDAGRRHLAGAAGGDVQAAGAVGGELDVDGQVRRGRRAGHERHLRVGWGRADSAAPSHAVAYCSTLTVKWRSVTKSTNRLRLSPLTSAGAGVAVARVGVDRVGAVDVGDGEAVVLQSVLDLGFELVLVAEQAAKTTTAMMMTARRRPPRPTSADTTSWSAGPEALRSRPVRRRGCRRPVPGCGYC